MSDREIGKLILAFLLFCGVSLVGMFFTRLFIDFLWYLQRNGL